MTPRRWLELRVHTPADVEGVAPILLELGGTAVEEAEGALLTYVAPPPELETFLEEARERLQKAVGDVRLQLTWRWQPQEDWESLWRQGLGLRRITSRLLVAPSWEDVPSEPGTLLITLDPGMAFGTAEHATTRGSLRALDAMVAPGSRVADVGAGSGILSIGAALLGAERVLAFEMDPLACETARENLARNGVQSQVEVVQALVDGTSALPQHPFDGIVANLQTHHLLPLMECFRESLTEKGWLVASGILVEEKETFLTAAAEAGFQLMRGDEEEGWWTGVLMAPAPRSG